MGKPGAFSALISLGILSAASAQVATFTTTLDDDASITSSGGTVQNNTAYTYVPGAIGNAFESTNSTANAGGYAKWANAAISTIFSTWSNTSGTTVDLYFRGDHWSTHTGDSGLWSIVRRSSDAFMIISVRNGKLRLLFNNNSGNTTQFKYTFDGGLTAGEIAPSVPLADNTTYRLTVRQLNGVFDVFIGGGAYSNASPIAGFNANLPAGYTWLLPPSNSGREMDVGNRGTNPNFGGTLQAGEWVDNVRVYNGFLSPTQIDTGGQPTAIISQDVTSGYAPLTVHFNGSSSHDNGGTGGGGIVSYAWDFDNDGTVDDSSGPIVTHQYTSAGSYTCKLTVTDNDGNTAASTVSITVNPPLATGLVIVTDLLPTGALTGSPQNVTSITAGGNTFTSLVGPPDTAHIEEDNLSLAPDSLVGLDLSTAMLGLGTTPGQAIRAYFDRPINADGTSKPEIFLLEWSGSTDNFQIQLLTNGPGQTPVIVASVPVFSYNYAGTASVFHAGGTTGNQPIGGVGINLDALGVTGIKGIQIPSDGNSGVDPCVVAAVVKPCNVPFADADGDGDVDMNDFAAFQRCYDGAGNTSAFDPVNCSCFDRGVRDFVIDDFDLTEFTKCLTKPGVQWSQALTPNCTP